MSLKDCCHFLRGDLLLADKTDGLSWSYNWNYCWSEPCSRAPGKKLGNVSSLTINIDSEEKSILQLNGNVYESDCSTTLINGVTFSMTVDCMSCANLTHAFLGKVRTEQAPDPVVDEIHFPTENVKFECGTCLLFEKPGVDISTVTAVRSDNGQVLELGTQYCVDECCVELQCDFILPPGAGILLSYSYDSSKSCTFIEALTEKPKEVSLIYKGKNIADNCAPFIVKLHNVRINPASALELINNDNFGSLEITGSLMADKTNKSKDLSSYFQICKLMES